MPCYKVTYFTNCCPFLFAGYCTEYSLGGNIIQQSLVATCTQFTKNPCPLRYQSTDAFKCKLNDCVASIFNWFIYYIKQFWKERVSEDMLIPSLVTGFAAQNFLKLCR